jgi:hypothetical protein
MLLIAATHPQFDSMTVREREREIICGIGEKVNKPKPRQSTI